MMESNCSFQERSIIAYIIGCFLIFGVMISYIPQHLAIIKRRSSQGISWITIFLANISTCSNTINAVLEQWDTLTCCFEFGFWKCNASLLSIYQISVGWFNSLLLFILVLLFFPKEIDIRNKRVAIISWWIYVVGLIFLSSGAGGILLYKEGSNSKVVSDYAFSFGIISTVAILCQWTPQIWKTWNAKEVGSLSIMMLLLQAPGSFIVVIFQGILYRESVSTWLTFLLTGIQQTILLILCLVFEFRRRQKTKLNQQETIQADEKNLFLIQHKLKMTVFDMTTICK